MTTIARPGAACLDAPAKATRSRIIGTGCGDHEPFSEIALPRAAIATCPCLDKLATEDKHRLQSLSYDEIAGTTPRPGAAPFEAHFHRDTLLKETW